MTREEAKELLPIMQAFAEGKKVEQKIEGLTNWHEVDDDLEISSITKHRIKPEPKYRPFQSQKECWNEMLKHQPFGWIKSKDNAEVVQIGRLVKVEGCGCLITSSIDGERKITPSYYYNNYTFTDGAPFGVKEE